MKLSGEKSAAALYKAPTLLNRGTRLRSWLRHCATSQKVSGSIPDEVIEFVD
jgi:hypothetical protein